MPFPGTQGQDLLNQSSYRPLTVTPELADQLATLQQNGAMVGQDPFQGVPVPQEGDNLLEFLSNLTFSGNSGWASDIAQMNGIPQQDFTALMQKVSDATSQGTSFLSKDFFNTLADSYIHNPLLMAATGLAAVGLSSPAAAAGGSGGTAVAGGAGGFGGAGGTLGATISPVVTGPLASGAGAITATPIAAGAAGLGGAAAAGGGAAAAGGAAAVPGVVGNALNTAGNVANAIPDWVGNYLLPGLNAAVGANAANNATDAQTAAYDRAIAENQRQYDTTRSDLAPWLTAGRDALGRLSDPNAFTASPDYAFRRDEGLRGIQNQAAARGTLKSGNALKALTEFNSNLAGSEYNNWFNRQAGIAGVGQNTGVTLGGLGANAAANAGNYMAGIGDARASGVLGRNAALIGGINSGYRNYLYGRP